MRFFSVFTLLAPSFLLGQTSSDKNLLKGQGGIFISSEIIRNNPDLCISGIESCKETSMVVPPVDGGGGGDGQEGNVDDEKL